MSLLGRMGPTMGRGCRVLLGLLRFVRSIGVELV